MLTKENAMTEDQNGQVRRDQLVASIGWVRTHRWWIAGGIFAAIILAAAWAGR